MQNWTKISNSYIQELGCNEMWEIAPVEDTREISLKDATGNNFLPPSAPLTP